MVDTMRFNQIVKEEQKGEQKKNRRSTSPTFSSGQEKDGSRKPLESASNWDKNKKRLM